jgi:flagellar hook-basal body complex protein FliE
MVSIGTSLISNLDKITGGSINKPSAIDSGSESELSDFASVLDKAMNKFESVSDENAQDTFDLLTGNTDDLAGTLISAEKSEIALNLTVAIRNKAVEAYKEIMNMQV